MRSSLSFPPVRRQPLSCDESQGAVERFRHRAHIHRSRTHLSEADGLHDVFVCKRENLVSTQGIPHLPGEHRSDFSQALSSNIIVTLFSNVLAQFVPPRLFK